MPPTADPSRARQTELILQQVEGLPTLSAVATRLLRIASADDPDLDQIVTLIESDPALTARLLGMCRRADRGLGDRITTVRRAVVMLGLEAVQSAVLSVQVYELMSRLGAGPRAEGEPPGRPGEHGGLARFDRAGFWRYCVGVACAAELIAEAHAPPRAEGRGRDAGPSPDEHFVAGLLHGLGKLVLDLVLPHTYARVLELAEHRRCDSAAAERAIIGLDHHTAGKRLAEHWALPHVLQDAVWLHAHPYASLPDLPHKRLVGVVGAARMLCRHLHVGWSGDFAAPGALGPLCASVGLDETKVMGVAPRLHAAVAERCAALGLEEASAPELLIESVLAANGRLGRLNGLLEARSRTGQRQARALAAITAFSGAWRPGRSVTDTLGAVVRSATEVLGPGFYAAVFQPRPGQPWQVWRFSAQGEAVRSELLDGPAAAPGGSLARLADPTQMSLGALGLLPWLSDHLADACDLRRVQLLPLAPTDPEAGGPAAVLLHDREPGPDWPDRASLAALAASWGAAVSGAAQHDGARVLGERLAAANQQLAEAQAALAEAESMARLGQMAAGAAHEMNNPLTVISGRSQLLASSLSGERDRAAATAILRASQQLSDLITSLKLIADPPTPVAERFVVDEAVRAAAGRAEERTGAPGRVRVEAGGADLAAVADRELLELALGEVIGNALEASAEGPVMVRTECEGPDGRLLIVVEDRGPGMSAKALQHAFDPFFSDKPAGRRTGLGLTRARRLVELQGGRIWLRSDPGEGTVATIELPRADEGRLRHPGAMDRAA